MQQRFVILHHQTDAGEHWDLMAEHGDVLLTWSLLREPVGQLALPLPAKRIHDHRKRYLDYEGPISGSRGWVRRVESGMVQIEELTGERCVLALSGEVLSGRFELRKEGNEWVFDRI
ncbi:MAG: hypothetical protein JSU63_00435 [Phycisphaerales bacterium]|nr:MAG: hypothetical protein JSU63_00435 [Phycisphaerales bacterium]